MILQRKVWSLLVSVIWCGLFQSSAQQIPPSGMQVPYIVMVLSRPRRLCWMSRRGNIGFLDVGIPESTQGNNAYKTNIYLCLVLSYPLVLLAALLHHWSGQPRPTRGPWHQPPCQLRLPEFTSCPCCGREVGQCGQMTVWLSSLLGHMQPLGHAISSSPPLVWKGLKLAEEKGGRDLVGWISLWHDTIRPRTRLCIWYLLLLC